MSIDSDGTLGSVWVLNWELAKYGPAAADLRLGQFTAEVWGLNRFRNCAAGGRFRDSYIAAAARVGLAKVNFAEVVVCLNHLPTHLVV